MNDPLVQMVVREQSGIRRFLYPLRSHFPFECVGTGAIDTLTLVDGNDAPIPTQIRRVGATLECDYAVSLAPFEDLRLAMVSKQTIDRAPIPDPLKVTASAQGLTTAQERLALTIGEDAQIASVVYDGVEHLAAKSSATLNGERMRVDGAPIYRFNLLSAHLIATGRYSEDLFGATHASLTCCKSWVKLSHSVRSGRPVIPAGILRLELPLTAREAHSTCDFGVGNGAYGKLDPSQRGQVKCIIESNAPERSYRVLSGSADKPLRTDYAGRLPSALDASERMWCHWSQPDKALALAVTKIPDTTRAVTIELNADGAIVVELAYEASASIVEVEVCYHFLNAVAPIAAATNPASIIFPPAVSVLNG